MTWVLILKLRVLVPSQFNTVGLSTVLPVLVSDSDGKVDTIISLYLMHEA